MSDNFTACRELLSDRHYLLSSLVPFMRDQRCDVWVGDRWHRDLMMHLRYLPHMIILAAQVDHLEGEDATRVEPEPGQSVEFVATGPMMTGRRQIPRVLPGMIRAMRQALARADAVHSGAAGWPIPPGLILNPMVVRRGLPLVINIESAFWRIPEGTDASLRWRAEAAATERFARWTCRHARLGIYTQRSYAESLPVGPGGISAVSPATWIHQQDVLTPDALARSWQEKPADLRLLLASRLTAEKGTGVVLQALRQLEAEGRQLQLDVVGSGSMAGQIAEFAAQARSLRVRILPEVAYATEFLPLLRGYHAALVPTTGDEQPRVILDAFSQGVPVIASDTAGNREVARDGQDAIFVPAGDAAALAQVLADPSLTPQRLRGLADAARDKAAASTHEMMHDQRAGLVHDALKGHMPERPAGSSR